MLAKSQRSLIHCENNNGAEERESNGDMIFPAPMLNLPPHLL